VFKAFVRDILGIGVEAEVDKIETEKKFEPKIGSPLIPELLNSNFGQASCQIFKKDENHIICSSPIWREARREVFGGLSAVVGFRKIESNFFSTPTTLAKAVCCWCRTTAER